MSTLAQLFPLRPTRLSFSRSNVNKYPNGILFIGDSITAHPTASYPALIRLRNPNVKVNVLAKPGMTTDWMRKNLPKVSGSRFSRAYIYAGINDAFGNKPLQNAVDNVQDMADTLRANGTEVFVVLGYEPEGFMDHNKMPTSRFIKRKTDFIPLISRYRQLQNLYAEKLKNVRIIPKFVLSPKMNFDGIHPIGSGQKVIADVISRTL